MGFSKVLVTKKRKKLSISVSKVFWSAQEDLNETIYQDISLSYKFIWAGNPSGPIKYPQRTDHLLHLIINWH